MEIGIYLVVLIVIFFYFKDKVNTLEQGINSLKEQNAEQYIMIKKLEENLYDEPVAYTGEIFDKTPQITKIKNQITKLEDTIKKITK